MFKDGGSIGGVFLDDEGDSVRFCLDQSMSRGEGEPGAVYLGATYFKNPEAVRIDVGSPAESTFVALVQGWIDHQIPRSEQQQAYENRYRRTEQEGSQVTQRQLARREVTAALTLVQRVAGQRQRFGGSKLDVPIYE